MNLPGRPTPDSSRLHGGPTARGPVRWDFSTNANAAGPCPGALQAVQAADPSRYPDPTYQALRERLARWHGVAPERILPAASASEFIQRITAVCARQAPGPVAVPQPGYGDYAAAARACGLPVVADDPAAASVAHRPTLRWCADPGSPLGQSQAPPADLVQVDTAGPAPGASGAGPADPKRPHAPVLTVLDCAYAPLRLQGSSPWSRAARDRVFQLYSPNKALGLTGVRGAYAVAPTPDTPGAAPWVAALQAAEPSWPLGAHAVALLTAWTDNGPQAWLEDSLERLGRWRQDLWSGLLALGLAPQPSVTPFFCARRPAAATAAWLHPRGLAVRCTESFGLPGGMRVSAQGPEAAQALLKALVDALREAGTPGAAPWC